MLVWSAESTLLKESRLCSKLVGAFFILDASSLTFRLRLIRAISKLNVLSMDHSLTAICRYSTVISMQSWIKRSSTDGSRCRCQELWTLWMIWAGVRRPAVAMRSSRTELNWTVPSASTLTAWTVVLRCTSIWPASSSRPIRWTKLMTTT